MQKFIMRDQYAEELSVFWIIKMAEIKDVLVWVLVWVSCLIYFLVVVIIIGSCGDKIAPFSAGLAPPFLHYVLVLCPS